MSRTPGLVQQPIVRVAVPGTTVTIVTGTHEAARTFFDAREIQLRDVLTSSLDSLESGLAERFEIRRDFGSGSVPIDGEQYALFAGDRWRAGERLWMTIGIRADLLDIGGHAPHNPVVDSIFDRRTDAMPGPRVHLSPRLGFDWDLLGAGRDWLRGGVGIFSVRPPVAWYHSSRSSFGIGVGTLRCGPLPTDSGQPPPFVPDHRAAPTACATGPDLTASPRGPVDLLEPGLGMARALRGSLAYDRRLPWDLFATAEALVTRNLSDFAFVNLNLVGPQGTDRDGRVLYGGPFRSTGQVAPETRSDFAEVIDLRNTSRNDSYQLSARLEKRFSGGSAAAGSYTYSRVRDVQTPLEEAQPIFRYEPTRPAWEIVETESAFQLQLALRYRF